MSLSEAIENGDELGILKATRDLVAERLESSESGRDTAALSRQMQELTEKISALEKKNSTKIGLTALEKARRKASNG